MTASGTQWWRSAVIYQIYPRSFADADGDGTGDLAGITGRLDHVASLGADAVWLSPFYPSPQLDGGYDVADYCDVDPRFGTLDDAVEMFARAHELGLRVIVDLVPNHSSWEHPDFRAALAAGPGSPERDKYIFRDGAGPDGALPPNDWQSLMHGPAWTRVTEPDGSPGQWYLHLFDASQPDWNWSNPAVREDFDRVLHFWLERGVDGFRVDVCDALVKAEGLPSWPHQTLGVVRAIDGHFPPMWDQEGIHEIFRRWRSVLDRYEGERILCAEAWLEPDRIARITREGEMHQAFNFAYLETRWRAADLRETIDVSLAANGAVGAPTTWVLSNHDVVRHATRFGYPADVAIPDGIGADDPQPDRALGLRRARAATMLMLGLPGAAYLYQGEELGLPEHTELPDEVRQDPSWARSGHTVLGRDGCRIPLPWTAEGHAYGFGPAGSPWLPQPEYFRDYAVDVQHGVEGSTLELYRRAIALRDERELGRGSLAWLPGLPDGVLGFVNGATTVVANTTDEMRPVPAVALDDVLLSSGDVVPGAVPANTTLWLRCADAADAHRPA